MSAMQRRRIEKLIQQRKEIEQAHHTFVVFERDDGLCDWLTKQPYQPVANQFVIVVDEDFQRD